MIKARPQPLDRRGIAPQQQNRSRSYKAPFAEVLIEEARDPRVNTSLVSGRRGRSCTGVRQALVDLQFGLDASTAQLAMQHCQAQKQIARSAG
jgi:hypothetical protein